MSETTSQFSFTAPRLEALWGSALRFPFAALAAIAFAVLLIAGNHNLFDDDVMTPIAYGLFAAFFATLAIGLTAEAQNWPRERLWLASALTLVMMVLWVYGLGKEIGLPHALLGFALFGLCMIAPHFGKASDDELWVFNQQSFYGLGIGGLAALVFQLGVSAVLWALSSLFDISSSKTYLDVSVIIYAVFWPLYTLTFVPRLPLKLLGQPGYPAPLSFVLTLVALPVLLVFAAVVALYGVQTMLLGKAPIGSVSWMVMGFAAAGIALHFLLYPLRAIGGQLVRFFWRYFFWLLVPLLGLLFWAVFIRIHAYGVTENRYLAVLGGFWAAGMCLLWLVRGNYRIWMAPASLAVLLVVASFGPWGAEGVSFTSQQKRLVVLLEDVGITKGGVLQEPADLTANWLQRRELSSLLDYFHERRDKQMPVVLQPLRELRDDDERSYVSWPNLVMLRYGLGYIDSWQRRSNQGEDAAAIEFMRYQSDSMMWSSHTPIRTAGYDWLLPFKVYRGGAAFSWSGVPLTAELKDNQLRLVQNGQALGQLELLPLLKVALDEPQSNRNGPVIEIEPPLSSGKARLRLEMIELERKDGGAWEVKNLSGQIFWQP